MSKFGCPGAEAPYNQTDDGITAMQDDVFNLLDGYIPSKYIDQILQLVAMGEQDAAEQQAEADQHREYQRLGREYQEWREQEDTIDPEFGTRTGNWNLKED